ncbi:MAG: hypothetical protein MRZ28_06645 [Oscillospiraceae bacterium]|nr:hypothetical protein [Oscillospiraceae bacterium]MDY3218435.1 hypothetical protein [Candidatus Fimivivens sp.]
MKKMGRPTDAPKRVQIAVRFDEKTLAIFDRFCEREGIGRAEGVRRAVERLKTEGQNECGRSYNAISIMHNTDAVCYLSFGRSAHRRRHEKESLRVPCLFTYLHRVYNFYALVFGCLAEKAGFFHARKEGYSWAETFLSPFLQRTISAMRSTK